MPASVKAATQIQIGKEVTRGTSVAATRRLTGNATVRRMMEHETYEDQLFGVLARSARLPTITRNAFEFEYRAPLAFQEILLPLLAGLKGGVTGAGVGADKTWTFTKPNTADPAPDTYTIEWVERDFTNDYEIESAFCFCTEFAISARDGGVPQLSATFVGRKAVESTKTAAIALPTLTFMANGRWQLYMDTTFAALGTTAIAGQIYGFDWKFSGFLFPQYYLDNRADLDFSTYHFKPGMVDLTIDAVINADAAGIIRAQQANRDTPALVFPELRLNGPALGGSAYTIKLQMAAVHAPDSMAERGADRDGNLVTRMHLLSQYDPTSGNDVQVIVVNDITAFP